MWNSLNQIEGIKWTIPQKNITDLFNNLDLNAVEWEHSCSGAKKEISNKL
tara:strand:- start:1047 stop:1196 length:150 start_codon:yes stop_codon:yes gene_type:complete